MMGRIPYARIANMYVPEMLRGHGSLVVFFIFQILRLKQHMCRPEFKRQIQSIRPKLRGIYSINCP